ncbi:dockerin type I repeat-containing protein [Geobacter sp. DSM 9736]|uniref:dockerin type I repeat-containing protein n=1 Tax=Geobacter sp. DSM 9736 TaxID=1277350 RepID=UPI000B5065BF|nr:dockerin type I repeat-containing protein [Geobacter sp. DSM 9736]SNB44958.1 hypothetical protein SAMN06269301_0350 [Geobacter sp. DSM 9736]
MKRIRQSCIKAALVSLIAAAAAPAHAELKAMGPVNPANGFPVWYQDTNSLSLDLCLDPLDAFCLQPIPVPNPAQPVSFPGNFPDEGFWWTGDASVNLATGGTADLVLALEAAFGNGAPAVGDQISFGRIRISIDDPPVPGTYRFIHPYGVREVTVGAGERIFDTRDIGATGQQFTGVLDPAQNDTEQVTTVDMYRFGPYLRWTDPDFPVTDPASGKRYVGNPNIPHAVTGSPFNTNFFRVEGPAGSNIGGPGVDFVQTSLFTVSGRLIGLGVEPFPAAAMTAVVGTPVLQEVTMTNITGSTVAFTGQNALAITGSPDFTIVPGVTDTCSGQTLQVPPATPSSCSFQVSFNPAASTVAARSAVLTITPDDTATAPPVSVTLAGTARFALTTSTAASATPAGSRVAGTVSPAGTVNVDAGGSQTYTFTPEAGYFPRVLVDGVLQTVTDNTVTFGNLGASHTVDVKFVRNGDVVEDGTINMSDAIKALRIAVGLDTPTNDERIAADVGPLVAGRPKADGAVRANDVLLILRRVVNLDPIW